MIPILFSETETTFNTNGIGRLYECISVKVYEERNGIYECDFEYPITGLHYQDIKIGRIIGVTHNLSGDIQPFDIVSYTKPINGVVSFHCVHISYRQNYMTLTCTGIQNLESALLKLPEAQPSNRFNYWTDKSSSGFLGASDGLPHTVRQILGGMQGSILDAYGGEYEWDKWNVNLYSSRGQLRDFSIRYGVNMLDYEEEYSMQGTYSSCIPFWTDGTTKVVGNRIESNGVTITQRGECVPLDLSDKFQEAPTQQELEAMAFNYMNRNDAFVPVQNIRVEFARIQDFDEYTGYQNLLDCNLCDTINVFFPDLSSSAQFKIVKTVWDVLRDRYESMELGDLSVTLSEALGVTQGTGTQMPNLENYAKLTDLDNYVKKSGDTMTGNLVVSASNDAERYLRASNSLGNVNLDIASTGNHGIWSNATPTHKWLLKADTSGNVYVNDTPFPNFATYSNNTFKIGNFVIWFGVASSVANGGTKSITIPSGTFDSVYKGIAYCAQSSFGGYSTCVMNSATATSATVYQYNSANASMNVGVVVFGIKN